MMVWQKTWVYNPKKQKVPCNIKREVNDRSAKIIDTILKPGHIKPVRKNARFNYIVDIYSKWRQNYFYFCSKYACPGPNAILPYFESKFARMEYIGNGCFNLSYMRHTEKWREIHTDLSFDECLNAVKNEPIFQP